MYLLYKYTIEHYHNVVNTPFIFFEKQYLEIKKGLPETKACSRQTCLKKRGAGKKYNSARHLFIRLHHL